jgi:nitrate reductase delta subunit
MARTLRALSRLLNYPDEALLDHMSDIGGALHAEAALGAVRLAEIDALIVSLQRQDPIDAQADYVQLFDSGRRTALYLFEHVHGDSRDRGPAMIDLAQMYEQAGLFLAEGEMPDHLPVVLEYASTQPPREATAFLGELAHLFNAIFNALEQRGSRYASLMGALLDLAGEPSRPVVIAEDEPLDASWAEPAAFSGCSSAGQMSPDAPQPVQIVRGAAQPRGSSPQVGGQP